MRVTMLTGNIDRTYQLDWYTMGYMRYARNKITKEGQKEWVQALNLPPFNGFPQSPDDLTDVLPRYPLLLLIHAQLIQAK
jgi:hypothetical protein